MPERPARFRMIFALAGGCILQACTSGCAFGPRVLERTHARYGEAIRRVDEEQLLRNLVHIRYNETPFKLRVSSIAAQYELAGGAEARPFFLAPNPGVSAFRTFTSVLPDVNVSGANRPTITLIPAGGDAIRRFSTPISAETLLFLTKTSWPVSTVMRLWAERLNGVPNAPTASGPQREFVPDFSRFQRIARLLQVAQDLELAIVFPEERDTFLGGPLPASAISASAVADATKNGLEYRPRGDGATWILVRKETKLVLQVNPAAADHPVINELSGLLNLRPGLERYDVVVADGHCRSPPLPPRAFRRAANHATVDGPGPLLPGQRSGSAARARRHRAGPAAAGRRWQSVRYAGCHRRSLFGARIQRPQAAIQRLCRGQVSRLLVLHRRMRPAHQGDVRLDPRAQPVGFRPPGDNQRSVLDVASGPLSGPEPEIGLGFTRISCGRTENRNRPCSRSR